MVEKSPFFRPSTPHVVVASKRRGTGTESAGSESLVAPEHKSDLVGCTANLMSCIVGSGIVGIPFAVSSAGFGAGLFLIILTAIIVYV